MFDDFDFENFDFSKIFMAVALMLAAGAAAFFGFNAISDTVTELMGNDTTTAITESVTNSAPLLEETKQNLIDTVEHNKTNAVNYIQQILDKATNQ